MNNTQKIINQIMAHSAFFYFLVEQRKSAGISSLFISNSDQLFWLMGDGWLQSLCELDGLIFEREICGVNIRWES